VKDFPTTEVCPRDDIAAYVDGELSPDASAVLELHIDDCGICRRSLRQQRQLLAALSASLRVEEDVELPGNFARVIVSNAQSSVSGLRRPGELFTSVFICAVLFLVAILSIGPDLPIVASALTVAGENLLALGSYLLKFSLCIAYALAVVVRTLGSHLAGAGSVGWLVLAVGTAAFLVSSVWVMRRRHV
jgi:anti-sigma factor RsiW